MTSPSFILWSAPMRCLLLQSMACKNPSAKSACTVRAKSFAVDPGCSNFTSGKTEPSLFCNFVSSSTGYAVSISSFSNTIVSKIF